MIINQATSQESQVTTLPEPSAALAGKIVQLVGNPPVTYTAEEVVIEGEDVPSVSNEDFVAFVVDNVSGTCSPTEINVTSARKSEGSDEWQINFQDEPDSVLVTVVKTSAQLTAAGFTGLSGLESFDIYSTITQSSSSDYTKGYFYECTNEAEYTITNLTYTPYPQGLVVTPTVESNADFLRLVTEYIGVSDPTQVSYITVRMTPNDLNFVAYDAEDNQLGSNIGMGQGQLEDEYHIIVESGDGLEYDQGWNWNVTITGSGGTYRWKQKDVQFGLGNLPTVDGSYSLRLEIINGVPSCHWDVM